MIILFIQNWVIICYAVGCGPTPLAQFNADIGEVMISYSVEETDECPNSSLFYKTECV